MVGDEREDPLKTSKLQHNVTVIGLFPQLQVRKHTFHLSEAI